MAPIPPPVSIPLSLEDDLASQLISDPNLLSELESLLALEFSGRFVFHRLLIVLCK